jgi:hypothetical protein
MWEGIWKGDDAKWFPTCVDSADVTMDFTTWNIRESIQKTIVYGTQYANSSVHCYKPPGVAQFASLYRSSANQDEFAGAESHLLSNLGAYLSYYMKPKSFERHYNILGKEITV